MASLYNLEPQPTAKAILRTTTGDLTLELFAKQTPLASRNFLQHCLDGYYTNTIFHRLVPNFIIQGGDPTGTGSGGESAINNGEPFQDEFHSRLKFNRRGLLGMANEGENSNGSQFFLTLGATPELQGKHTLFGRIEGDTIYNLMKMAEAEMTEGEGSERPLYPTKVTGAEVLVNPFEDMIARVKEAPRSKVEEKGREQGKKRKKPAGKNVLSFGGGDDGEEDAAPVVVKKAKVNPKLVSTGIEDGEKVEAKVAKEKKVKRRSPSPPPQPEVQETIKAPPPAAKPSAAEDSSDSEPEPEAPKQSALDRTNAEIAAIKASMRRKVDTAPVEKAKPKSALEAMIPMNSTRGRKRGKASDEKGAMEMFNAFKQRLQDMPASTEPTVTNGKSHAPINGTTTTDPDKATAEAEAGADDDEEAALCDLHFIANCQSCKSWDDPEANEGEEDDDDADWMSHKLSFAKDKLGKDLEWKRKMEHEIEVIDPREKARDIKAENRRGRDERKGKGKERVGGKR